MNYVYYVQYATSRPTLCTHVHCAYTIRFDLRVWYYAHE